MSSLDKTICRFWGGDDFKNGLKIFLVIMVWACITMLIFIVITPSVDSLMLKLIPDDVWMEYNLSNLPQYWKDWFHSQPEAIAHYSRLPAMFFLIVLPVIVSAVMFLLAMIRNPDCNKLKY